MVDGRLVALDTPAALKEAWVPGRLLSVRGRGLLDAAAALRGREGLAAVEPFGAGLRVRLEERSGWDEDALREALSRAGASELRIEPSAATLEDVFLAVVAPPRGEARPDPGAAAPPPFTPSAGGEARP